jgi:hypothetical protein
LRQVRDHTRICAEAPERRIREITLADEALAKGFHREAERHDCTRKRIEELLKDLGEPAPMTVD